MNTTKDYKLCKDCDCLEKDDQSQSFSCKEGLFKGLALIKVIVLTSIEAGCDDYD